MIYSMGGNEEYMSKIVKVEFPQSWMVRKIFDNMTTEESSEGVKQQVPAEYRPENAKNDPRAVDEKKVGKWIDSIPKWAGGNMGWFKVERETAYFQKVEAIPIKSFMAAYYKQDPEPEKVRAWYKQHAVVLNQELENDETYWVMWASFDKINRVCRVYMSISLLENPKNMIKETEAIMSKFQFEPAEKGKRNKGAGKGRTANPEFNIPLPERYQITEDDVPDTVAKGKGKKGSHNAQNVATEAARKCFPYRISWHTVEDYPTSEQKKKGYRQNTLAWQRLWNRVQDTIWNEAQGFSRT